jgi:prepilin-type N-terminal cleavage/methylation domain-containing protein
MHAERSDNFLTIPTRERAFTMSTRARAFTMPTRARAFTIIELLVVIGIIAILTVITTIGARRLTSSSRLAAGTNAVTNMLGIARAAAIRDSAVTAIVFRPIWNAANPSVPQRVEMIVVRPTGDRTFFPGSPGGVAERFLPVAGVPPIPLPEGIKVAGPMYDPPGSFGGIPAEQVFATQAELPVLVNCSETIEFNRTVAIMFGPQGEFLTRPPNSSITLDAKSYVDWNRNGSSPTPPADPQDAAVGNCASGNFETFWLQDHPDDECNLMFVPFLVVYDDKAAREVKGLPWSNDTNVINELTGPAGYIAQFGDRITFNRFSGIPERKVR